MISKKSIKAVCEDEFYNLLKINNALNYKGEIKEIYNYNNKLMLTRFNYKTFSKNHKITSSYKLFLTCFCCKKSLYIDVKTIYYNKILKKDLIIKCFDCSTKEEKNQPEKYYGREGYYESRLWNKLEDNKISNNIHILRNQSIKRYFPDLIIKVNNKIIIVEYDEKNHYDSIKSIGDDYYYDNQLKRQNKIISALKQDYEQISFIRIPASNKFGEIYDQNYTVKYLTELIKTLSLIDIEIKVNPLEIWSYTSIKDWYYSCILSKIIKEISI